MYVGSLQVDFRVEQSRINIMRGKKDVLFSSHNIYICMYVCMYILYIYIYNLWKNYALLNDIDSKRIPRVVAFKVIICILEKQASCTL